MPSARLVLREEDVVRLALEFLHNRDLHISQLSLERETGVINGNYSDDVLFLRQLILDGQWDDVLEFIQPLEALKTFDMRKFSYAILKHKYIELLCIKSEANVQGSSVDNAVEEVVKVLNELEKYSPTKEDYSTLCLLLTLPRLTDHLQYKDWNPSNARVQCFREVYPLVAEFLPGDKKSADSNANAFARNDRLIQLVIKGILYESCVNYCQAKATGTTDSHSHEMTFSRLLDGSVGFSDSDLSLLSWLQSVPSETFSVPFEQKTLNVDVERLERPSLETSWTEHMLVTPIKPKTFPHSAMPFTRPRSAADIMTRSLMPVLDGLPYGLSQSTAVQNGNPRAMAMSTGDISLNGPMSRSSFASFHLTGMKNNKLMNSSVDRLFENEGEVFLSNSYAEFQQLPCIQEATSTPKVYNPSPSAQTAPKSPERKFSNASTPEHRGRESPASVGTARSSRRDSLNERPLAAPHHQNLTLTAPAVIEGNLDQSYSGELVKEFQKTKQKLQEAMVIREREREELIRQLQGGGHGQGESNGKYAEECKTNKNVNGNITSGSPKPNMNGTGDAYRSDMSGALSHMAAVKRLEALFQDVKIDSRKSPEMHVEIKSKHSAKCDIHKHNRSGSLGSTLHLTNRRDSLGHVINQKRDWHHPGYFGGGVGPRRESMPALNNQSHYLNGGFHRRRESLGIPLSPPKREIEHPSQFSSTLRRDLSSSSINSTGNNRWGDKRNSFGGSMSSLNGKNHLQVPGANLRRNSRNYSTDSLDNKRNSWDPGRRGSSGSSCGWEEPIWEDRKVFIGIVSNGEGQRWQSTDMLASRNSFPSYFPPSNPKRNSYPFRPPEAAFWRDIPPHFRPPAFNYPPKVRDYHLLPPFFRNVMPPPPNPNRLLMVDPRRWTTSVARSEGIPQNHPPCYCSAGTIMANGNPKSKSMEDVREFVVEYENDHNGNKVERRVKGRIEGRLEGRRSMENLLDDNRYSPQGGRPRQRIVGVNGVNGVNGINGVNRRTPTSGAYYDRKPVPRTNSEGDQNDSSNGSPKPKFVAVTSLEDVQAVRCAEFHPGGQLYAVGSNSKTLRICAYPKLTDLREDHQTYQPMVLFKRTKHHKGSIYCLAWSPVGDLMATGSNDKTVKLMRFNSDTSNLEGEEIELSMHDGTVRDLCFLEDTTNKSSLLISGGAGDCKIYVTDCATGTPFQALSGHTGHVLALYTWGGAMFVSGSHDKTVRFWDLRTRGCVNMVTPITQPGTRQGSPVAGLCVDPSGRLLVSGHEDSSCVLYDIRGGRNVQCFKPHSADVRSIRFSPSAYYLLSGGYDNKLVLTDLQGDLTLPLPSVVVAQHADKVISGRWHPTEFSFLSTSADKTATLWALPPI